MRKVLVVSFGTYCDNALVRCYIRQVRKSFDIVALTDVKDASFEKGDKVYKYSAPAWLTQDVELNAANSSKSLVTSVVKNMPNMIAVTSWLQATRKIFADILRDHPDISALLVWYPAMPILVSCATLIPDWPVAILYCAPGFANGSLPWLFDAVYKSPKFELYSPASKNAAGTSWSVQIQRMTYLMMMHANGPLKILENLWNRAYHVATWDALVIPDEVQPKYGKFVRVGMCHPDTPAKPDRDLVQYVEQDSKKLIFLSFGSYSKAPQLKHTMSMLCTALDMYCVANNARVLFHNPPKMPISPHITPYTKFIPYEYIVQKSDLVIFTGSVCLQNICLFFKTRFLLVPLLSEQFFWAKNYQHFTNVAYIDYTAAEHNTAYVILAILNEALTSRAAKQWIDSVSAHARGMPSADVGIAKLLAHLFPSTEKHRLWNYFSRIHQYLSPKKSAK